MLTSTLPFNSLHNLADKLQKLFPVRMQLQRKALMQPILCWLVPLPSYIPMLFQHPDSWTLSKDLAFLVCPIISHILTQESRSLGKIRLPGASRQAPATESGVLAGGTSLLHLWASISRGMTAAVPSSRVTGVGLGSACKRAPALIHSGGKSKCQVSPQQFLFQNVVSLGNFHS